MTDECKNRFNSWICQVHIENNQSMNIWGVLFWSCTSDKYFIMYFIRNWTLHSQKWFEEHDPYFIPTHQTKSNPNKLYSFSKHILGFSRLTYCICTKWKKIISITDFNDCFEFIFIFFRSKERIYSTKFQKKIAFKFPKKLHSNYLVSNSYKWQNVLMLGSCNLSLCWYKIGKNEMFIEENRVQRLVTFEMCNHNIQL